MNEWLFSKLFPVKALEMNTLRSINRSLEKRDEKREGELNFEKTLNRNQMGTIVELEDQLATKTLELETLKNKIVERAQVPTILKAKSAAEIRRRVEAENERELEEQSQ